jgi:adenylylsulfate kinase
MESQARSIAKAATYRVLGSISTAGIVAIFTGNWKLSAGAGVADIVVKIVMYFIHERIWNYIQFGRNESASEYIQQSRAA